MKCYDYYDTCNKQCQKNKCRYWVNSVKDGNCVIAKSKKGLSTLQEIGELFNITRMRVCQIEKNAIKKASKACLK